MNDVLKNFLINALRRCSFRWRPRSIAERKARVQVGTYSTGRPKFQYRCAGCGNLFLKKDVDWDHVVPVVPPEGYKSGKDFDLEEFAERLFCEEDGWQILCHAVCHAHKTEAELKQRMHHRNIRKERNIECITRAPKSKRKVAVKVYGEISNG